MLWFIFVSSIMQFISFYGMSELAFSIIVTISMFHVVLQIQLYNSRFIWSLKFPTSLVSLQYIGNWIKEWIHWPSYDASTGSALPCNYDYLHFSESDRKNYQLKIFLSLLSAKFLKLEQLDHDQYLPTEAIGVSMDGTGQVGTYFYTAPEVEQKWPQINEKVRTNYVGLLAQGMNKKKSICKMWLATLWDMF